MCWTIQPGLCPRGVATVPGDKSISHRALLLGAIADGETRLGNVPEGADVASTAGCLVQLGCRVERRGDHVVVQGRGLRGLTAPAAIVDCGNSGTTMRLLAGIVAGQGFAATLDGDASLRRRPMERIAVPLRRMGAKLELSEGRAPLQVTGRRLRAIRYTTPIPSAQLKSCVLFAALYADGPTTVRESAPSRDHTERLLRAMGARIDGVASMSGVTIEPVSSLRPLRGRIPGDVSSATFWLVAALAAPGADITLENVGLNPGRAAVVDLLRRWGADIDVVAGESWHGEPTAMLRVRGATRPLSGGRVEADEVVPLIDEIPALALLGTQCAEGLTVHDAGELRFKESDRIETTVAAIGALGGVAEERRDGLVVPGGQVLRGGTVDSAGDHRIALATAAISPAIDGMVRIRGAQAATVSYPDFMPELERLGRGGR